ncbi:MULTISPECIES: hypothetical protein [unclassified Caballeronia]|uniref:hypothetical protein n=1 Tax=unclassified Caballeronia TaxID=2646786 RepID=UPI0028668111|nr:MULTISPECIES: hypothetical protein [unclassified Caballeronia]MDR5754106.1 hypothetical protein [Caballeronia sp. LZ024]MDR5840484.1 hypothetical protein [Caballeronia sp. LZ031]
MNDNTPLEQFSALDDWAPSAPVWRPYVQERTSMPRTVECRAAEAGASTWAQ